MDYCVHSVTYTYYPMKAVRFNPLRFTAMLITSLQLTQMNIGYAINVWALDCLKTYGQQSCNTSHTNINLSIVICSSYFVLFAKFFYKTYPSLEGKKSNLRNMAALLAGKCTSGNKLYDNNRLAVSHNLHYHLVQHNN